MRGLPRWTFRAAAPHKVAIALHAAVARRHEDDDLAGRDIFQRQERLLDPRISGLASGVLRPFLWIEVAQLVALG